MAPKRVRARSGTKKEPETFKLDEIPAGFTITAEEKPRTTYYRYLLFHSKAKSAIGRYLSNFAAARVRFHGHWYPSVEHAFQAAKFLFTDGKLHVLDLASDRPGGAWTSVAAKRYGSKKSFASLGLTLDTDAWNGSASRIMGELLRSRARHDPLFKKIVRKANRQGVALLHHERAGSRAFWGGAFDKTRRRFDGANRLGLLMMHEL
jgi:predicted NAD-dependent protein-ADP-ribosyltransferase YbiA (DUF1768 family)